MHNDTKESDATKFDGFEFAFHIENAFHHEILEIKDLKDLVEEKNTTMSEKERLEILRNKFLE